MFRRGAPVERGVWCDGESIYVHGEKLLEVSQIKIPGWHNVENYMAAIAAVWGDVEPQTIRHVAETFAGVEHRAEFVRELRGVKYYNDSIATSPTPPAWWRKPWRGWSPGGFWGGWGGA